MSYTAILSGIVAATAAIEALTKLAEAYSREDITADELNAIKARAERSDTAWDERVEQIKVKRRQETKTTPAEDMIAAVETHVGIRDRLVERATEMFNAGEISSEEYQELLIEATKQ